MLTTSYRDAAISGVGRATGLLATARAYPTQYALDTTRPLCLHTFLAMLDHKHMKPVDILRAAQCSQGAYVPYQ